MGIFHHIFKMKDITTNNDAHYYFFLYVIIEVSNQLSVQPVQVRSFFWKDLTIFFLED